MVSATIQDILRRFKQTYEGITPTEVTQLNALPDQVCAYLFTAVLINIIPFTR